jgi:hypothetical protein
MSNYFQDLKNNQPAKYADMMKVGWITSSSDPMLKNMVKALSMMRALNTPEEEARLEAGKRLLRNKY